MGTFISNAAEIMSTESVRKPHQNTSEISLTRAAAWKAWSQGIAVSSTTFITIGLLIGQTIRAVKLKANSLPFNLHTYNAIGHGVFITLWIAAVVLLLITSWKSSKPKPQLDIIALARRVSLWIKLHPLTTILLTTYLVTMIVNASWFYKEIVTWYDDIQANQLIDNFSIRWSFIHEVRGRNDFRFFPLSHQDLHILSWLTPYPKVWALANAFELIITLLAGIKLVQCLQPKPTNAGISLIACLIYLFTPSAAYNYFQFIYSERIMTLNLALFGLTYINYQRSRQDNHALIALLLALIGCFTKDIGVLLFAAPAIFTFILGSLGMHEYYPSWKQVSRQQWLQAYRLEIGLCSLALFFFAAFTWLSYLPGVVAGVDRYDAGLGFSLFTPDLRTFVVIAYSLIRLFKVLRQRSKANVLDSLNVGAVSYGAALFALVGFRSSSYMALPVQLIATLDILMVWRTWALPRFKQRWPKAKPALAGAGFSAVIVGLEHTSATTFFNQVSDIRSTQLSWQTTLQETIRLAQTTKEKGEPVNLIFSKSWFKHSEYLRSLPFDRLIYIDPDTKETRVIAGINKGKTYQPKSGDYFLNIDSGKKLSKYNIDLSSYDLIYDFNPSLSQGKIYRHR